MKNFTIKNKWRQILCGHSEALRGEVYNAVIEYVAEGRIAEMSEAAMVAFDFIRYDIDASKRSKAKRLERKDNSVSIAEAGSVAEDSERVDDAVNERAEPDSSGCEHTAPAAVVDEAACDDYGTVAPEDIAVDAEPEILSGGMTPAAEIKTVQTYGFRGKTKRFKAVKVSKILKGRRQRIKSY